MSYRDPDKRKEYNREYHKKHAFKLSEYGKQWRKENKAHVKGQSDLYYREHREEIINRNGVYSKNHPEVRRRIEHDRNQRRNAPYHEVLDNAGIERKCVVCGSVENMHTHHIDGNHNNNDLSNLQWLCSSCHSKLHAQLRRERDAKEVTVCVN